MFETAAFNRPQRTEKRVTRDNSEASEAWNPAQSNHVKLLVQQKFLKYVAFEINKPIAKTCHSHENILNASNTTNLEQRGTVADLTLFFQIFHQFDDCPKILVFYMIAI